MKLCEVKSAKLRRLLEELKAKRNQKPLGSMDERVDALEKRFLEHVQKSSDCWNWTGVKTYNGYGRIGVGRKLERTHRLSWMLYRGEIETGQVICHACDNPTCVNPAHLWVGTQKQNLQDAGRKNRTSIGEKHACAKLKAVQVLEIRSSGLGPSALAVKYGISESQIYKIVRRINWKNLKGKA